MTDWTHPDSPAPLSDDEQHEAAMQWFQVRMRIRGGEPAAVIPVLPAPPEPEPKRKRGRPKKQPDRF